MLVNATPLRERGKALDHQDVQWVSAVNRDILVVQEKAAALNRYSNVARFQVSRANGPQPLPPLHDAVLSSMGPSRWLAMSGIEFVDGMVPTRNHGGAGRRHRSKGCQRLTRKR